jgi:superfamily II DNA or RNA helicase
VFDFPFDLSNLEKEISVGNSLIASKSISSQQTFSPGAIVTCRGRQWVVLPVGSPEMLRLRPLSGNEEEICGLYQPLGLESVEPAEFPLPTVETVQDHTAAQLLMDAARLSLRSGAGPFRCLGRLSVRPRPYQLVPLLMALRLEVVRLLISDDVGIGKTIEAGLIARELLDRGEVKRLAVLCPPHLCDQWQQELSAKFNIDAVVVRSGTVAKLERNLSVSQASDQHIFGYYKHLIISLDYAKSEKRLASLLVHCPDLVIVDEAHTCAQPGGQNLHQQQRHQLLQNIAQKPEQHLLLLTATPHSGFEESFLSLLGLLRPEFAQLHLEQLTGTDRDQLAAHFVQRRRVDVQQWLGETTPFPEREALELHYTLSPEYRDLFEQVYDFARGLVRTATGEMSYGQRRGRYWSALALIRCVMSSPAAAVATLNKQIDNRQAAAQDEVEAPDSLGEAWLGAYVYDPTEQEQAIDAQPTVAIEQGQASFGTSERRKLKAFVQAAKRLQEGAKDKKLQYTLATVTDLLQQGVSPILWCRYIATANYVAAALKQALERKQSQVRVLAITGETSEDERRALLDELVTYPQRVLVATDCLSEGVNLQEHFAAVIHYDLPWNPNRLSQREGRIDRYGQPAPVIQSVLLYGKDNPVDGAVMDVLIRKAVQIHKSLGVTVPVPMDSRAVSEAVFKSLFDQAADVQQLSLLSLLDDPSSTVEQVHQRWDLAVDREKLNRTKFAQRSIKPAEVEQELQESDLILGNEADVERFVRAACERLNASLVKQKQGWLLRQPPNCLKSAFPKHDYLFSFTTPAPEGMEYVGRNHPLVEGLSRYLLEDALVNHSDPLAARCGFTVTDAVSKRTTLLLLRLRHLLHGDKAQHLLTEECWVVGFTGSTADPLWLEPDVAQALMHQARPVAERPMALKQSELGALLERLEELHSDLELFAQQRAQTLVQSHRRVRAMTREGAIRVKAQPLDILGIYILQPK